MNQAAESNDAEFASFVAARWEPLVILTRSMLGAGSGSDAEDPVQEGLIRLASRWDTIREPDAYMHRILANLTTDHHRRSGRWRKLWPPLVARTRLEVEPSTDLVDSTRAAIDLLADLPTRQRQVLALFYLTDASESQISETLGCSVGTVKTHLSRGLATLRVSMADASPPESKGWQ